MDTESSIKAYLDSLAQVPGAILYRNGLHWQGLAPGSAGQVLALTEAGLPAWQTLAPYHPAYQQYTAGTGYFWKINLTLGNNADTHVCRLIRPPFTGLASQAISEAWTPAGVRTDLLVMPNDLVNVAQRNLIQISARAPGGTFLWRVFSETNVCDGLPHTVHAVLNGTTGAATLTVDGQVEDNLNPALARLPPYPITFNAGANSKVTFGARQDGTQKFTGYLGYAGYDDLGASVASSFMDSQGHPKDIEATVSTAWTRNPRAWHESGRFDENRGAALAFIKAGTIVMAPASLWS